MVNEIDKKIKDTFVSFYSKNVDNGTQKCSSRKTYQNRYANLRWSYSIIYELGPLIVAHLFLLDSISMMKALVRKAEQDAVSFRVEVRYLLAGPFPFFRKK